MAILPSKARPTWAGVLVKQPGGDVLVPWRDAVDLRVVRRDGRWVRIDFDLRDEKRARLLRTRALRNLWRAGEPVAWGKPVVGPTWLEAVGMLIPVGCCVTLGVMALTFAMGRMMSLNGAIRAEGISPLLGTLMWAALVLLTIAGIGALGFGWFWVRFWQREARSLTIQGETLTLVRRDRTIVVHACEVANVERSIGGARIITTGGEAVSLGQICPAAYEPWLGSLPRAGSPTPFPSLWTVWVVALSGFGLLGVQRVLQQSGLMAEAESGASGASIVVFTIGMGGILWWARRHALSNAP